LIRGVRRVTLTSGKGFRKLGGGGREAGFRGPAIK